MNKPLSAYWCVQHWAPFADNAVAASIINNAMPKFVCNWKPFVDEVNRLCRDTGISAANARTVVVREWTLEKGRPMCCLIPAGEMERMTREALGSEPN